MIYRIVELKKVEKFLQEEYTNMNFKNLSRPCIQVLNTYLQNNCNPNNTKMDSIIKNIDGIFLQTKKIDRQIYLYKNIDLLYDKNKHKSQLSNYKGIYRGYLLTNLYPDSNISKEVQQMILKINVSEGSRCILLDDTDVLLNRNSIISITSIDKFIINISYKSLH